MDCERFDKGTMDLLYGELDELSEAAALRHLHHCTRCRDIWTHLRTTRDLAELPMEAPPSDLFESILEAERSAHKHLTSRERFSRAISILAGYAMTPQVAMAAILLLMIGSSLVFIRTTPTERGEVSITELGTPYTEKLSNLPAKSGALVFGRDSDNQNDGTDPTGEKASHPVGKASGAKNEFDASRGERAHPDENGRRAYSEAMAAYQDGRYAEAERLFSEVASSGSSQAAAAALHEGHAARNGSGCQRAATLYDATAARHGGSTVADEASWHAASCYRAMGQIQRASAHYTKLQERPAYASRAQKSLDELNAQQMLVSKSKTSPARDDAQQRASEQSKAVASRKSKVSSKKKKPPSPTSKPTTKEPKNSADGSFKTPTGL